MGCAAAAAGRPAANGPLTARFERRPASDAGERLFAGAVKRHLAGDIDAALREYERALAARSDFPEALNNAGAILAARREDARAIGMLRKAVTLKPAYADAHRNLGLALAQSGQHDDAAAALRAAVRLDASRWSWWLDLGNALMMAQRYQDALAAYDHAIVVAPREANAHANRGAALRGLRRHGEAVDACRAALAIQPGHPDALLNLSVILKEARAFEDALEVSRQAVAAQPNAAAPLANLAVLYMELNRHDDARAVAAELVQRHPDDPAGWNVLGNCALEAGDYATAEQCHHTALSRDVHDRNAQWNLAVITLLSGDLEKGFLMFEARKRLVSVVFNRRIFQQPEWDGSPLEGRSIFLHMEQGAGDVVQFIRYAAQLKSRGAGRVIVECPANLVALISTAPGVDDVVTHGADIPAFDVHAYLMSLPFLCGTTTDTVPAEVPYLSAPERNVRALINSVRARLRVGVAWAGNRAHQRDAIRSIPFSVFESLLDVDGVKFFSLQKEGTGHGAQGTDTAGLVDLSEHLDDFGDTAAAIAEMDLVITVDTSVAHIAGALGKPVWILLPTVPDWRWMRDREDSPWYPSARLIRQTKRGDWGEVIAQVKGMLAGAEGTGHGAQPALPRNPFPVPAAPCPDHRIPLIISWQIGLTSGWGTYGLNLALALTRSTRAKPVLAHAPVLDALPPFAHRVVRDLPMVRAHDTTPSVSLVGLGNKFLGDDRRPEIRPARRAGVVFFEDTALDAASIARARSYDAMIAGSTWNAELMKAFGIPNVHLVLQGVDHSIFHPAPRAGMFADRFVIFSGGKLEYRKGQDIVVEAFRRFHATHPDALLVTAWHNHWPQTLGGIDRAGYVRGVPVVRDGRLQVTEWLVANGLPPGAFVDIGQQSQLAIAQILRETDVAVFPNRCEGGTNLVAMEAMACGVAAILSANTGHLNLIGHDTCYALQTQRAVSAPKEMYAGTDFWGESNPDEIVAMLEKAYDDRNDAAQRGSNGASLMQQLPWSAQTELLLDVLAIGNRQ